MSRIPPATFAMSIAIVGEEPTVAEVLARLLARELPAAQIVSATSVADLPPTLIPALAFVRASDFYRQGFADIWLMRQRAPASAIVVTCTTLSLTDAAYVRVCGAAAVLHKPFTRAGLRTVLGRVLPDAETDGRHDGVGPPRITAPLYHRKSLSCATVSPLRGAIALAHHAAASLAVLRDEPPGAVDVSGDSPDTACNALVWAEVYSGRKTWGRHHTESCGAAPTCCVQCTASVCVPARCRVHRVTV